MEIINYITIFFQSFAVFSIIGLVFSFLLYYFLYFYYTFKKINNYLEVEFSKRRQIFNLFLFFIISMFFYAVTAILLKLDFIKLYNSDTDYIILSLIGIIINPLSYYIIIRKESSENFLKSFFVILFFMILFSILFQIILFFLLVLIYLIFNLILFLI